MTKWVERCCLFLILLAAAWLRFTGLDWDDYHHYHPDERYIAWMATTIERPSSIQTALSPTTSTFNPFYWPPAAASDGIVVPQDERRDFAYGHLPLYLGVIATRVVEKVAPLLLPLLPQDWLLVDDILNGSGAVEFRHLTAVARALTGLVDDGTGFLLFLLGRRLFSAGVGLLAAALLAVNVLHIQLAHFFIADPYLTFFSLAALLSMVCALPARGTAVTPSLPPRARRFWLLAAVFSGLAIGSKFSAALLLLPLALTTWILFTRRWEWRLLAAIGVLFLTFFLTNPFAVIDFGCDVALSAVEIGSVELPRLQLGSCLLENISKQGSMVRGDRDVAFARQYAGTTPYLYFLEMQWKWGMGPLLALLAFGGLAWAIWRAARELDWRRWRELPEQVTIPPLAGHLVLLAWCLPFLLVTGNFQVKFMRYLQPVTPLLVLYGAAWLGSWPRRRRWALGAAVLLATGLYAAAFLNIYRQPHPWVAASEWIYRHVPAETLILSEQWDDALPTTLYVDGERRRGAEYANEELTWLTYADERDTVARLDANLQRLAAAEYVVIASNRVYGVVPRLDGRYPLSSQYHQLLFDGALGYEPVFIADRAPVLAGVRLGPESFDWPGLRPPAAVAAYLQEKGGISWGRADESFTVYDQPLTIIFQNQGGRSAAEMRALFKVDE